MRQDQQVHDLIREKRDIERNSACCVRNDRSGCVQTSEEECSVGKQPFILGSLTFAALHQREAVGNVDFFFSEYSGCVGEMAGASQHSQVKW